MDEGPGPLHGVVVVEVSQNVAGPFATLVLSQLGARVIKVERPEGGDDTRTWGPPFWAGESVMFSVMNAGKESVALDLDRSEDAARLWELLDDADVLLSTWRPGSLERRGFTAEAVAARNPRIVHAAISGFGTQGPLASAPGYDPLIQAFSGLMSLTGEDGGGPVRAGTSIIDMGAALWAVIGILAALDERRRTGRGGQVTTSLLETGIAWLPYQTVGYLATGDEPLRLGTGLPMLVPYQAFATADRDLVIAAGNDSLWRRLCSVIGREDLGQDPSLATNPQRVAARERVIGELGAVLRREPAAHWEALLAEAGVPCCPVQTVGEALAHPQTQALGMLRPVAHPDIDEFQLLGLPLTFDGRRPGPTSPPPRLSSERRGDGDSPPGDDAQ
jgi:crotonobetainyl-CoA:carnitine CoA-transferase CaiB-like acyl-CoA transferase